MSELCDLSVLMRIICEDLYTNFYLLNGSVQSNSRAWSSRKEILDLFVEEQRLHIAWHRFSFSGSWLLPPKISERTWEKVALVVCIKDK